MCWGWGGGSQQPAGTGARKPGPVPSAALLPVSLLPACPSLPTTQLRGWGLPAACPPNARDCHLPRLAQGTPGALLSPVLSATSTAPLPASLLRSCPLLSPTHSHVAAYGLMYTWGTREAPPVPASSSSRQSHSPKVSGVLPSPGWGEPPWVTCCSHLAGPIHAKHWASAGQGHRELRAKGQGRGGWCHVRCGSVCAPGCKKKHKLLLHLKFEVFRGSLCSPQ